MSETDVTRNDLEAGDPADEKLNPQIRADARRFAILELVLNRPHLTTTDILDDNNFSRRFFDTKQTRERRERAISDDIVKIQNLFREPRVIYELDGGIGSRPREPFISLGYGGRTEPKQKIADVIVKDYLDHSDEVIYLSTGTTVYETALSLVHAMECGDKPNIRVILTDNLAIVDLFCWLVPSSERLRKVQLVVMGGSADFDKGDIALEATFAQLAQWDCSTAVVSATKVNPRTGTISSFRQPETKKKFFSEVVAGQVVIPVVSSKIDEKGGGCLIYDPSKPDKGTTQNCHIVTEKLDEAIVKQLEKWYTVRVALE